MRGSGTVIFGQADVGGSANPVRGASDRAPALPQTINLTLTVGLRHSWLRPLQSKRNIDRFGPLQKLLMETVAAYSTINLL